MTDPDVVQRFTDLGDGRTALETWRKRDVADCVGFDGDVWEYFAILPPDVVAANRADLGLPPTNEGSCDE